MTQLTCEDFGLSKEQMAERLIETMCDKLLGLTSEPDEDTEYGTMRMEKIYDKMLKLIKQRIDDQVQALFDKSILPHVDSMLANLMIPHTNKYGEPKKTPQTLIEYATEVSERYLDEPVDRSGKTKKKDSYSWTKHSTRLMFAVDKHLSDVLNESIKGATQEVTSTFLKQVRAAVDETIKKLTLSVSANIGTK